MRLVDNIFNSMLEKKSAPAISAAVQDLDNTAENYNPEVMAWLNSTSWYKGNPNYITFEEAAAVTSDQFSEIPNAQKRAIVTFDEAKYFTSVTYLRNYAFYNCKLLERITLQNTLTSIGYQAFRDCTSLALTSLPSSITSIGDSAFKGCTSLALTSLPSSITSISGSAFYGCTSLVLTSLPSGITSIGDYAFYGCTSLALTLLPSGLTSIGIYAFNGCTSLALTSLPNGITSISNSAFDGCTALALTSLPNGLTTIGVQAFQSCLTLKDTLHEIPSSVTELGDRAFRYVKFPSLKFLGLTPPTFGTQSICALPKEVDCQVPGASLAEYKEAMKVLTDEGLVIISTY